MNFLQNIQNIFGISNDRPQNDLSKETPTTFEWHHHGKSLSYTIKRSRRRKHLQIQITSSSISVLLPQKFSDEKAHTCIRTKADWIIKNLQKIKTRKSHPKPVFQHQELHFYFGQQYPLNIQIAPYKKIDFQNHQILIQTPSDDPKMIQSILSDGYLIQAKNKFSQILEECWNIFSQDHSYSKPILRIKRMKTRWGSLSDRGSINLNAYLILSSIECIRYVIFHELCHFVHFNHSQKFHHLVSRYCPNWKDHHLFLKTLDLKEC